MKKPWSTKHRPKRPKKTTKEWPKENRQKAEDSKDQTAFFDLSE